MNDFYFTKPAGDGRTVYVHPLTFGRARISIGDEYVFDDSW